MAYAVVNGIPGSSETPRPQTSIRSVEVLEVLDGDTIAVRLRGDRVRVRLLGIDAPEIAHDPAQRSECYADQAAAALKALTPPGTTVRLTTDPSQPNTDRYDRQLRYVATTNADAGQALLKMGAARLYSNVDDLTKKNAYTAAAHQAETTGEGLWSTCDRNSG